MNKLHDIVTTFSLDMQTDLQPLLTAEGLTAFEQIQIGGSRDSKKISLFIYDNSVQRSYSENRLSMYFQAQLYRVSYEDSLKYQEVITDYLIAYEPENLGMTILENIEIESMDIMQDLSVYIYFAVTFSEPLDSCD
jgi:hypothetical protein